MKNITRLGIAVFFIVILANAGCSDDPVSPTNENGEKALATATIGSEGGEIVADEFTLSIPPSSFSTSSEIKIYASTTENPFGENQAPKSFRIEGLPSDYTKPLKVSIKKNSDGASTERVLALGEESVVHGELRTGYNFLATIDSSGFVFGELPIPEPGLHNMQKITGIQKGVLIFMPQSPYGVYLSSGRHFSVDFLLSIGSDGPAKLGEYLEDAYQKILDLGFSYSARTNWPVRITLRQLATGTDGLAYCSWFGNNYGFIELNTALLSDDSKLHITAGHEFFHLVQFLYDTRSGLTKSAYSSRHHWLNEATAAWFEEKLTEITNYTPDVLKGGEHHPFDGLQFDPYDDNEKIKDNFMAQCYGRTPIIKYLVDRYGQGIIINIFNDIKDGMHPIDAVCQTYPDEWWEDFLKEYILGNVYNLGQADKDKVTHDVLRDARTGLFRIRTESDLTKTFKKNQQDLSAKLYAVQLEYSEIDEKSQAVFSISGASKQYLSLFRYKREGKIEYINSDDNEVIIKDLRALRDNDWNLYALVSNNRYSSPYTSGNEITLEIKVEGGKNDLDLINECTVKLMTPGNMHYEYSDGTQSDVTETIILGARFEGSFIGNTFTGSYNYNSHGITTKDTMIATLNNNRNTVSDISWSSIVKYDPVAFGKDSVAEGFSATDIPLFYSNTENDLLQFRLSGNGVCNMLTKVYYKFYSYQRRETLIDYSCDDNTYINIVFKKSQ